MKSQTYWLSWLPSMTLGLMPLAFGFGFANATDLLLIGAFTLSRNRTAIIQFLKNHQNSVLVVGGVLAGSAALYCLFKALSKQKPQTASNKNIDIEPKFIPCGTTHTRFFPKKHSFSYSYLLAGFQVGWKGSVGSLLSVETGNYEENSKEVTKDWFAVDAGDYLERGYGQLGLEGKLHRYLRSQNVDPTEYPYAYLVTVPKLLGYSFNPISFWYLYSAERALTAMVLEVNNTFDERHPYFMKISESQQPDESSSSNVDGLPRKPTRFTNTWSKDFHVSPFNSRKGAYSLIAYDPLFPHMTGTGPIDNTITLLSSKSHPKLVAHVSSKGSSIDPSKMGFISRMKFLSSWWWVVWATAIRTIKEAVTLYFTHGLHVWFRPEPLNKTIGRNADETEKELEVLFRKYLRFLVDNSKTPVRMNYIAAGLPITNSTATFSSPSADIRPNSDVTEELEFKVLTPLFYTRFIHYAFDSEAFSTESSDFGTIHLSNPSALQTLVSNATQSEAQPSASSKTTATYFQLFKKLRRNPDILSISQPGKKVEDLSPLKPKTIPSREKSLSDIDKFVLSEATKEDQYRYARTVLRLFLSERVAIGPLDVLSLGQLFGRIVGAWLVSSELHFGFGSR